MIEKLTEKLVLLEGYIVKSDDIFYKVNRDRCSNGEIEKSLSSDEKCSIGSYVFEKNLNQCPQNLLKNKETLSQFLHCCT